MSNDQNKNKTILDDEKFIDELYAQLNEEAASSESNSLSSEQPSALLDEKILAAAHQSVNIEPTVININNDVSNQKVKRVKKPRAWYFPVGFAASTLLAVSLVINQSNEVLVNSQPALQPNLQTNPQPSTEIMHSVTVPASGSVSADNEVASLLAQTEVNEAIQVKTQRLKAEKSRQVANRARAAFHRAKKIPPRATTELSMADKVVLSESKISAVQPELSTINEIKEAAVAPWLSTAQYKLFLKQNRLWSLVDENDAAYVINIVNGSEKAEQYSVSKQAFNISGFTDQKTKKYSFKLIEIK